ncbi:MAG TPA: hypothetical protein VEU47_12500, partial [Candidatus Cybelea sp.]|nr:hypothetical protein [Candidatus Cybelea sp.]
LVWRRGESFQTLDREALHSVIARFYGPRAIYLQIEPALDAAGRCLRAGRIERAQNFVDSIGLPPVSPNGWKLMHVIAKRHGLAIPVLTIAKDQSGTIWDRRTADLLAEGYDRLVPRARRLEKMFAPSAADRSDCHDCGARALSRANYNPDESRDEHGRWTSDDNASPTQSKSPSGRDPLLIPAQMPGALAPRPWIMPRPVPMPVPVPRPVIPPSEVMPVPPVVVPREPVNPYPDRPECVEEWDHAKKYCEDLIRKGRLGKGDNWNSGDSYYQCVRGQVSEACGGAPTA